VELTPASVEVFQEGQIEVKYPKQNRLYRGQISKLWIDGAELIVEYEWKAKGEGYPITRSWVLVPAEASTPEKIYFACYTIKRLEKGIVRLTSRQREIVCLFPKGVSPLAHGDVKPW